MKQLKQEKLSLDVCQLDLFLIESLSLFFLLSNLSQRKKERKRKEFELM
jgi:hypothetical protein